MSARTMIMKEDIIVVEDVTENDSDKTFTVPANEIWEILTLHVKLISTATVGTRQIGVEIQNVGGDVMYAIAAVPTQVASLTQTYNFAQGGADRSGLVANRALSNLARLKLTPGMIVRVLDFAVADVAADDMDVRMLILKTEL
ncbi:MAG: hypothetical protein V3S55_15520 [Nitrospiraceae bacterium]